jgi:PHD and RING finger domain-containing protein 1
MEKEQLKKELRTAVLKVEKLERELYTVRKLMEDEDADREYEKAHMMKRIEELEERENLLRAVLTENLRDCSCNEPETECDGNDGSDPAEEGDITEHASWYCTTGRELTGSSWNPYWESQERAEESSEGAGTLSTTVPPDASMSYGSTVGQSEVCTICLCGFVTQEVGTPEACNHSFCADCLQEWLKTTNTCPIDRQVCDIILVRRCLGGEVVRRIHVEPPRQEEEIEVINYLMRCEVCGDINSFNELIYCDRCGRGYHLECVYPHFDIVILERLENLEEWFCSDCY